MSEMFPEDVSELTLDQITEFFLIGVVTVASIAFLGISILSGPVSLLSTVFYGVVPISLTLILILTFNVVKMIYKDYQDGDTHMKELSMAIVIGVAALNLGFMTVVSSGPVMIEGAAGLLRFMLLVVLLSFALSISILTRTTLDIE